MRTSHEMILVESKRTGAEEWACPHCERRVLLRWPPAYERLVLSRGDETVAHVGGKGGLRPGGLSVSAVPEPDSADRNWLRASGIDWNEPYGPPS